MELTFQSDLEIPFSVIEYSHPKPERLEVDKEPRYAKDPKKKTSKDKEVELDTTGQGAEKKQNHIIVDQPPIAFSFKKTDNNKKHE